jgi:sec-independent protein translocase protein TatA
MILLFFNIGGGEIVVLLLVILLVFGPKQAVDVARKTGKALSDLRRVTQSVKDEIMKEDDLEQDKKETERTTTI